LGGRRTRHRRRRDIFANPAVPRPGVAKFRGADPQAGLGADQKHRHDGRQYLQRLADRGFRPLPHRPGRDACAPLGERALPVEDFFTGYRKTARAPGEFLRAIRIPRLAGGETFFAYKLAKRFDQDISTVAAAFKLHIAGDTIIHARAGFGGLAATPLRGHGIEAAFAGKPLEAGTFARAAAEVETHFAPISDVRATAAYRLAATAGLLHRLGEDALQAGAVTDIFAL
jgi:hypothetical protein